MYGITTQKWNKKNVITIMLEEIFKLLNVQKRRIKMYYFDNLSLEQIAIIEECSFQAISKSILIGINALKKI